MITKISGFTIIELMLTVAIAGILVAVALPSFRNMANNNCLTTSVNSITANLQRARSEAIKRRTNVTIAATGGDWSNGWSVTLNEDRDGDGVIDLGEDIDGSGDLGNVTIQTATPTCGAIITGSETDFTYGSDGFIDTAGTFSVCDDRDDETGRQISISLTGRPNLDAEYDGCNP